METCEPAKRCIEVIIASEESFVGVLDCLNIIILLSTNMPNNCMPVSKSYANLRELGVSWNGTYNSTGKANARLTSLRADT